MRVMRLEGSGRIYSSNVYLVRGDWNALADVNTLVDVGQDPAVVAQIEAAATGVGKRKIERVVLTHSHSDHAALLPLIRERYRPEVLAFSSALEGVDRRLQDGDRIRMGDREFEVLHAPAHSDDSICLYSQQEGVLFAGDAPLAVDSPDGAYDERFLLLLERLVGSGVKVIYPGHGEPLQRDCAARLRASLDNVRRSLARQGPGP